MGLNACYSLQQAQKISENGIYVVGMNDQIEDEKAIQFSVGFYIGIVNEENPRKAYQFGLAGLNPGKGDSLVPELWYNGSRIEI